MTDRSRRAPRSRDAGAERGRLDVGGSASPPVTATTSPASGIKRLHVELSGAQTGSWDFLGEHDGYAVQDLPVKGGTTVTYWAEDNAGTSSRRTRWRC